MGEIRTHAGRPRRRVGDASALARRLDALPRPAMRRRVLAEFVAESAPDVVVETLLQLLVASRVQPTPSIEKAVELLTLALSDTEIISYPVRCDIYEAAKRADCDEIACLMFQLDGPDPADDAAAPRPLTPKGRPLSLGERKSLARGQRRDVLLALLRDPHADVIGILLDNPYVTERDVVTAASRRPSPPGTLETIASSDRWLARYRVRLALVRNPATPRHLSLRIVASLSNPDVKSIAADTKLPDGLRDQARRLLRYAKRTVH